LDFAFCQKYIGKKKTLKTYTFVSLGMVDSENNFVLYMCDLWYFPRPLIQLQPTKSLPSTYSIAKVSAKALQCLVCYVPFLAITFCLANVSYFLT